MFLFIFQFNCSITYITVRNHSFNLNNIVQMNEFINIIKKDPQVKMRIGYVLDKNNRLSYIYQSKVGYGSLIQNVILKEILN